MDIDIGSGVTIRFDDDGNGLIWRHPGCRAWMTLRFRPDPKSTGHKLVAGSKDNPQSLTIEGSLLCPKCKKFHGHIINGKWKPD